MSDQESSRKRLKQDDSETAESIKQENQKKHTGNAQIHAFPVFPLSKYQGPCAVYKQPVEIGCFSFDAQRNQHMDISELRYYYEPDLSNADLSHGYDVFIDRDKMILEHIDALLDALTHIRKENSADEGKTKADFITWRGIITKIMCIPYSRNEPLELGATLWNGTIYIEEHLTEYKIRNQSGSNPRHALMTYWGYKFESLSTIPKPPSQLELPSDPVLQQRKQEIVDTNIQYATVVKTKLGGNSIVVGAEVDCIEDKKPTPPADPLSKYIELKTSRIIRLPRDEAIFEKHKLLKFWAQSFLIGTPTIICGFRDDDGYVKNVQSFRTLDIPRMVRGKTGMWDATICLNFADAVLDWLKTVVTIDDPKVTYTIRWDSPYKQLEVVCEGKEKSFLTDRYLKSFGFEPVDKQDD